MREAGYRWQAVSPTPAVHKLIFAASKFEFEVGDLPPPNSTDRRSRIFSI